MTPADELMALAGRIEDLETERDADAILKRDAVAAELRAIIDSDAFRAVTRDAERWRFLMEHGATLSFQTAEADCMAFLPEDRDGFIAAIDAAASGAGEERNGQG